MSKTFLQMVNGREIFRLLNSAGKVFGYQVDANGRSFSTLQAARRFARRTPQLIDAKKHIGLVITKLLVGRNDT